MRRPGLLLVSYWSQVNVARYGLSSLRLPTNLPLGLRQSPPESPVIIAGFGIMTDPIPGGSVMFVAMGMYSSLYRFVSVMPEL